MHVQLCANLSKLCAARRFNQNRGQKPEDRSQRIFFFLAFLAPWPLSSQLPLCFIIALCYNDDDGMTEEEFIAEMLKLNGELTVLNPEAW
jgi:hypothetical protein